MIRGILFDKDATLLDFEKTWGQWSLTFLGRLAEGDQDLLQRLADAVGFDLERVTFDPASPVIAGTPEEGVDLVLPLLPHWERDTLLAFSNETAREAPVHPIVPLEPVLDALRAKVLLGIATNDSEAAARRHMTALRVEDRFAIILGSDSGFGGKPAPGMCLAFAEQQGLDPAEVAMVGDSTHDLEAGRAAGMVCVGVTSGFATRDDLAPHADHVFPDISHLPDWLSAGTA